MDVVSGGLTVTVRYFAAAAEAAGRQEELLVFDPGSTLGDLRARLEQQYGDAMARVLRSGSFLVDKVVRRNTDHPLADRVDVLPPFAGG
jgi:molybdopterin converting factor small subunit